MKRLEEFDEKFVLKNKELLKRYLKFSIKYSINKIIKKIRIL